MCLVLTPQACLSITGTGFGQGTGDAAGVKCCYGTMYLWMEGSGDSNKTCDGIVFIPESFVFPIHRRQSLRPQCVL